MRSLINPLFCLFVATILTGISPTARAQEFPPKVPLPVEFMPGNNRMFFQLVVKRSFFPESKFGFLSISSFATGYNNDLEDVDMAIPVLTTYSITKGFGLVGGITINNKTGYTPLLGAQHSFVNKEWVAVTIASVFLNTSKNLELFGIYEYKPSITPKLNLYNRIQFLYIHNPMENSHARSFLQLRTGLKIQALNFGLGANLDQYGPAKTFKPNYGIFAGWVFQ
jgi:hypothetical protein